MRKNILAFLLLALMVAALIMSINASAASDRSLPLHSSAAELLDAVNALRASHGLASYQADSILMGIAQAQAEYVLALGAITHTGPGGTRPYQRALAAGYLLAGDLSQGGFFSENITAGVGQTADDAVSVWTGDDAHLNTMLSNVLQDAGTGVAYSGDTFYYVLDAGRSTGGVPIAYTPPPPAQQATPTIIPNTPNADGSIIHIVQTGDTLGSLSLAYGVPMADLLKLNGFTIKSVIYVNQKIVIRAAFTPTATSPTGTPTIRQTITEWPTSTAVDATLPPAATPSPAAGISQANAGGVVSVIIISAVVIAGVITALGARKKK